MHRLCDEINDTLQEVGQMTIADLSKDFGLPMDFVLEVRPRSVELAAVCGTQFLTPSPPP